MVFTKDGLLRLLITVFVSAAICVSAALIFYDFVLEDGIVLKSIALGSIIWFVTEVSFEAIGKIWPHNALPGFIVHGLIIIGGTTAGLLIFDVKEINIILLIDTLALICGMTIAIVNMRRYKNKLNKQLKEFREK